MAIIYQLTELASDSSQLLSLFNEFKHVKSTCFKGVFS